MNAKKVNITTNIGRLTQPLGVSRHQGQAIERPGEAAAEIKNEFV